MPVFLMVIALAGCGQHAEPEAALPTAVPTALAVALKPETDGDDLPGGEHTDAPVAPVSPQPAATSEPPPSLTAVPTRTASPAPSQTPTPLATPTPTLPPVPTEVYVNGVAPGWFILMPQETVQRAREIFRQGQIAGRDPHRFSKIGDSVVDTDEFFTWFDTDNYELGDYGYLQGAIDYFAGSYGRYGAALRDGLNTTAVMDPTWADKELCQPNESPLACELRLHNPSILLIHFGTNDWTGTYDSNLRQILDYAIDQGVVPILITKANRVEAGNYRNEIVRALAAEYHVPVWDFDRLADTLPNHGLDQDNAHMTINQRPSYNSAWTITTGYGAFNLTGLMVLDTFLREVIIGSVE